MGGAPYLIRTDDLPLTFTTIVFTTLSVCGLDFVLAVAYALGFSCKVSTLAQHNFVLASSALP